MIQVPSPAKLNLFLHVIGQRQDGYHNIQTVFQFVDFCDEITFKETNNKQIRVDGFDDDIAEKDNIIYKAAKCLQQHAPDKGVTITVNKRLPIGGGVGGGSSNAATTLLSLNEIWQLGLSIYELIELGKKLGADVPIFLHGHSSWAEGIGDRLTPIILPEPHYVLLMPQNKVNTTHFFNDRRLTRDSDALTIAHYNPNVGHNDFEPLARMDYPAVANALDWLGQYAHARMTGTGSTVFAGFDTPEEAGRIAALAPKQFRAICAKGLNHSPLHAYWGVAKR